MTVNFRKYSVHRAIDSRKIEVIDGDLAAVLRAKTPAERVEMISAANRTARLLAAAGIRYQHPDWSDEQVQAEVIKRVCGGTV
jgi:hypothetical protein